MRLGLLNGKVPWLGAMPAPGASKVVMVCAEVDIARATKMIVAGTRWSFFFAEYNDFILLNATTSRKTDHSSVKFCAIVIPIVWSEDLCARCSNDGATLPESAKSG